MSLSKSTKKCIQAIGYQGHLHCFLRVGPVHKYSADLCRRDHILIIIHLFERSRQLLEHRHEHLREMEFRHDERGQEKVNKVPMVTFCIRRWLTGDE